MNLDKKQIEMAIEKWDVTLSESHLPHWEELPPIELYMDQVVTLLGNYISVMGGEKVITQPMINNYVKLGIMPPPSKKRYSRHHIAYLIIICFLKQTLGMDTIKRIIPVGITEDEVKSVYESFVENQKKAFDYVIDNIKSVAGPILDTESEKRMNDLIIQVSVASNICKVLAEGIIKYSEE